MNIYETIEKVVNGVKRQFVLIDINEYNEFIINNNIIIKNNKIKDELIKKREEKHDEVENKRLELILTKERRYEEKENERINKINMEIINNKIINDNIKKEKEELKETYKDIFETNPDSKIKRCDFCSSYRVFPYHFKDENNKTYLRSYVKDKTEQKAACCVDCFEEAENKKEERNLDNTHYCAVCDKNIIAFGDDFYIRHLSSNHHMKKQAILKGNINNNLKLLSIKELHKIVSRTTDERGVIRISNYTRMKKDELIKKMNDIYNLLVFE